MSEFVHVAVDGMGGDNAPLEIVRGTVNALNKCPNLKVTLTGREELIKPELEKLKYPADRISILNCTEVIEMAEPPVDAIRTKKDSSIVKGLRLVKDGECDAFVTAGSTGAALAGGQLLVGRIKGIERPPLAPMLPTAKGPVLLIDCGANMDPRPTMLVQFAQMGSIYMRNMTGRENPRVGLVNVGTEEEKGNELAKQAHQLLKDCPGINFVGNIEAREIPEGVVDVAVTDAFTGNAILKMYEGVAKVILHELKGALMSTLVSKIGALMIKPALKGMIKTFDASEYGGAPMLGLKGLVVKAHGNSKAAEIEHALEQCITFKEKKINDLFCSEMKLDELAAARRAGKKKTDE
jgi:glycerol-3-phosphate acyltransferase PlsX